MSQKKKPEKAGGGTIALNKKARFDYFIEQTYEAGIALLGWEVKSIRAGRIQLVDSYVILKENQAWLFNALITPLPAASTHVDTNPSRTRRLLMHRQELDRLIGSVERAGYTIVPLALYWKKHHVKLEIGLAKGKKQHDKRASEKDKDWKMEKARLFKHKD